MEKERGILMLLQVFIAITLIGTSLNHLQTIFFRHYTWRVPCFQHTNKLSIGFSCHWHQFYFLFKLVKILVRLVNGETNRWYQFACLLYRKNMLSLLKDIRDIQNCYNSASSVKTKKNFLCFRGNTRGLSFIRVFIMVWS